MKTQITIILLCSILNTQAQTDSTLYKKVSEMMDLMGVTDNMKITLKEIVALEQKEIAFQIHEDFWKEYMNEIQKDNFKELKDRLIPIYLKNFSQEDIDGILTFFRSKPGQSLRQKQPIVIEDAMRAGGEVGKKVATRVMDNITIADTEKFNVEIEGCSQFHEGTFLYHLPDGSDVNIIRTKEIQIEKAAHGEFRFRINWINQCKYELISENEPHNKIIANIYAIEGNTFKYIYKIEGLVFPFKSEQTKIE